MHCPTRQGPGSWEPCASPSALALQGPGALLLNRRSYWLMAPGKNKDLVLLHYRLCAEPPAEPAVPAAPAGFLRKRGRTPSMVSAPGVGQPG